MDSRSGPAVAEPEGQGALRATARRGRGSAGKGPLLSARYVKPGRRHGALQQIRATFRRVGVPPSGETGAHETVLALEARVGTYLLVTPPSTGLKPEPTVAVLALGAGAEGLRVALIRPAADGAGGPGHPQDSAGRRRDPREDRGPGRPRIRPVLTLPRLTRVRI